MSQHRLFFVTAVACQRQPYFRRPPVAGLFLENLFHYRDQGAYRLHDFVLMPDHFHIILTPSANLSLERVIQRIKGGFSFRAGRDLNLRSEIWQRSFTRHLILNLGDLEHHREYTLENPVRAKLVSKSSDYPYSSVQSRFKMDIVDAFDVLEVDPQFDPRPGEHFRRG